MPKPTQQVASSIPSSAAAKPYRLVLEARTVTDCTGPPANTRASAVGPEAEAGDRLEYDRPSRALRARALVYDTRHRLVRDPAALATSRMLTEGDRSLMSFNAAGAGIA